MKKPKPPKPPREMCRTYADYILGAVSSSRLLKYSMKIAMEEVNEEKLDEKTTKNKQVF